MTLVDNGIPQWANVVRQLANVVPQLANMKPQLANVAGGEGEMVGMGVFNN